jgi:hypothetical protein
MRTILFVEQLQDGVDGGEIGPPQDGSAGGTEDGKDQAPAVRQSVTKGAEEIFHGTHEPKARRNAGFVAARFRVLAQVSVTDKGEYGVRRVSVF